MNQDLRKYIAEHALTSEETCKLLGVSRQRLAAIASDPKSSLKPFKTSKGGNLYFKDDVVDYINSHISITSLGYKREIIGYYTSEAIEAIKTLINSQKIKIEDIEQILIYRYESDAVKDGCWIEYGGYSPKSLLSILAPTLVIHLSNGEQFWFHGLNCGYNGEGPSGSKEVLNKLFNINDPKLDDYLRELKSIIITKVGDGKWTIQPGNYDTDIDELDYLPLAFRCFEHRLVLAETKHESRYNASRTKSFIARIMPYMLYPSQIIFTQEHSTIYGNDKYNTIIRDKSGTELWLYNIFSESIDATLKRILKQKNLHLITLKEVLEGLEFEIDEKLLTEEEIKYLNTPLQMHTIKPPRS